MLIIYKKVGGILKKVMSILLVMCLSGCTVLDFFAHNKNNHLMNSTQDHNKTTTDSKSEIGTVNQDNIDQKLYLYYYEQLTQTQKEAYLELYKALQNQSAIYELKTPISIKDFNIAFYAFEYDFQKLSGCGIIGISQMMKIKLHGCSLMCHLIYPQQWHRLIKL